MTSLSCGSKPTDPRTVIPGDSLVYLETTDLEKTLRAIVDNPKFEAAAVSKPNLNALKGIKLSIAVTGFETSEQTLTEENSVLNFQPRFVAVAETNAWGWQTTSFIEDQLGEFVNDVYGGEVQLDVIPRTDGKSYTWTSPDGRKAHAYQQGSLVFFGNDESAIDRCLAVQRGEAESIATNSKITEAGDRIAFGYVSTEGIGQIANIAGISLAMGASEEDEVKSFVARVLPEILRNSVREITWTAHQHVEGVEDRIVLKLDDESSRVFNQTIVPAGSAAPDAGMTHLIPQTAVSSTRYLLADPQRAWRSVVLTAQKKTDETSGALIAAFSGSVFEPYGIEDPELFLSAVGSQLLTVKLGTDGDDAVVIAAVKEGSKVRKSIAKEIDLARGPYAPDMWRSEDGELAAAFVADLIVVGDAETVLKCLEARNAGANTELSRRLSSSDAAAVTVALDAESTAKIVDLLSERKNENERHDSFYTTETRYNRNGIERRTISAFGLIGSIIARIVQE